MANAVARVPGPQHQHQLGPSELMLRQMIEHMPLNVMMTDADLRICYVNQRSLGTLRKLEQWLPVSAEQVLGSSIDIFHKRPAHQRRILAGGSRLPHSARVQVGPELLELNIVPIHDAEGRYVQPMVTWDIVTDQVRAEEEAQRLKAQKAKEDERLRSGVDEILRVVRMAVAGDLRVEVGVRGQDPVGQVGQALADWVVAWRADLSKMGEMPPSSPAPPRSCRRRPA